MIIEGRPRATIMRSPSEQDFIPRTRSRGMLAPGVVHYAMCRWRLLVGIRDSQPRPCDLNDDLSSSAPRAPRTKWVRRDGYERMDSRGWMTERRWTFASVMHVCLLAKIHSISLQRRMARMYQGRDCRKSNKLQKQPCTDMLHYYGNWYYGKSGNFYIRSVLRI